jgi:hypothetical protein
MKKIDLNDPNADFQIEHMFDDLLDAINNEVGIAEDQEYESEDVALDAAVDAVNKAIESESE